MNLCEAATFYPLGARQSVRIWWGEEVVRGGMEGSEQTRRVNKGQQEEMSKEGL